MLTYRRRYMIRCHLSNLMGRKLRLRMSRERQALTAARSTARYRESAARVDMEAIEKIWKLFGCEVGELLEFVNNEPMSSPVSRGRRRAP